MPEYNVRIKIRSPRRLRPGEDKIWQIFGKIVRIKNSDFGSFRLRHPSVLSGVLVYPRRKFHHWHYSFPHLTNTVWFPIISLSVLVSICRRLLCGLFHPVFEYSRTALLILNVVMFLTQQAAGTNPYPTSCHWCRNEILPELKFSWISGTLTRGAVRKPYVLPADDLDTQLRLYCSTLLGFALHHWIMSCRPLSLLNLRTYRPRIRPRNHRTLLLKVDNRQQCYH